MIYGSSQLVIFLSHGTKFEAFLTTLLVTMFIMSWHGSFNMMKAGNYVVTNVVGLGL